MRASSLLAFRCYFELPSINKDFTSHHFSVLTLSPCALSQLNHSKRGLKESFFVSFFVRKQQNGKYQTKFLGLNTDLDLLQNFVDCD